MNPLFSLQRDRSDLGDCGLNDSELSRIQLRAERYISTLPPSIQGQGGSTALFKVCCALVRGFALDLDISLLLLKKWNLEKAQPPWSEQELRRTLNNASHATQPLGYLLNQGLEGRHTFGGSRSSNEELRAAAHRRQWPTIRALNRAEMQAVADLRQLPLDAVDLACRQRILGAAKVGGHDCFVLHEGCFAQGRRIDGKPMSSADGNPIKAKNLPGSQGAFFGTGSLGETAPILLVEGCIGWLEAVAAILVTDRTDWTVLAATSASSRFRRDPGLLKALTGRSVRILPDGDEAGEQAAASWFADLEQVDCQVNAISLPNGIKDLGGLVLSGTADMKTLNSLFE